MTRSNWFSLLIAGITILLILAVGLHWFYSQHESILCSFHSQLFSAASSIYTASSNVRTRLRRPSPVVRYERHFSNSNHFLLHINFCWLIPKASYPWVCLLHVAIYHARALSTVHWTGIGTSHHNNLQAQPADSKIRPVTSHLNWLWCYLVRNPRIGPDYAHFRTTWVQPYPWTPSNCQCNSNSNKLFRNAAKEHMQ